MCVITGRVDAGIRWPHNVLAMLKCFAVNEFYCLQKYQATSVQKYAV
jgi:hypothetical protein